MSVFLVNLTRENVEDIRFQHECLALGYLSGALEEAGIEVRCVDRQLYNISEEEIIKQILDWNPLLVGISASVQETFPYIINFIKKLRLSGFRNHVTIGGVFASIESERILISFGEIDSICIGEGEKVIVDLFHTLKINGSLGDIEGLKFRRGATINTNKKIVFNKDLDSTPYPGRRDVLRLKELGRRISMVASRGCIGNCVFCSSQSLRCLGLPRRQRTPENVVKEMYFLYKKYNVKKIKFNDPVFITPGSQGVKWGNDFCDELEKLADYKPDFTANLRSKECINEQLMKRLVEVGLSKVVLGIESGSDNILRWMRKPTTVELNNQAIKVLKAVGVNMEVCFIFFVPVMTLNDIRDNLHFLQKHDAVNPFYLTSVLEVYCGSKAEEILQQNNNLYRKNWWDLGRFEYTDPQMFQFWKFVQPVLAEYGKMTEKLHLLDILVQKHKSDDKGPRMVEMLDRMVKRSGEGLMEAYLMLADMVENGNVEKTRILEEYYIQSAGKATDLTKHAQELLDLYHE